MLEQWLLVGCVVFVGATIQSAAGFGFGVLLVPTLVYLKVDPAVAIMLALFLVTPINMTTYWATRKHVGHLHLLPFIVLVLVVQPFGVWLLEQLKMQSDQSIKAFFGGMILFVLVLQWLLKVKPRAKVHGGWGVLAFGCSGIMGGMCGMHGPPLAIWTMAHLWSSQRIRGSMMFCFLVWAPFLIGNYWLKYPQAGVQTLQYIPVAAPVAAIGLWVGLMAGKRIDRKVLRIVITCMLIVVSMLSIWQSLVSVAARIAGNS